MRRLTAGFLAYIFLSVFPFAYAQDTFKFDGVRLPTDVKPIDVSGSRFSIFSGLWVGRWGSRVKHVFYISSISDDGNAEAIYANGKNLARGTGGGWFRVNVKLEDDTLLVSNPKFSARYRISGEGKMTGTLANDTGFAVMKRIDPSSLNLQNFTPPWTSGEQIFLDTKLMEVGKPVKLETILHRPEGPGPFPLAIISHGSTGRGNNSVIFEQTWQNDWIAEHLNQRGWIVAFPQRRGRGKSDGLYDEGFEEDRKKGYTCETGISLKGADRALADVDAAIAALQNRTDVNDAPVLMIGYSRGGVLSSAYAGTHPDAVAGVINFSGGWMGDGCENATTINQSLFRKAAKFPHNTLWIYGEDDVFYSSAHSRANFQAFLDAGGKGQFWEMTVAGNDNGHYAIYVPPLWTDEFNSYLDELATN